RIAGLAPGDWLIESAEVDSPLADLAWPGVADPALATPITVTAGGEATGTGLALSSGGTLAGTITGAGAAIQGVTVYAIAAPANPLQFRFATTATDGTFTMRGL